MDVITAALALLLAVFVAAAGTQAASEFKAWSPRLVRGVLTAALRRVPDRLRDRLSEEWAAHLDDTPGETGKLVCACGFLLASWRLRRQGQRPLRWRDLLSTPDRERRLVAAMYDALRENHVIVSRDGMLSPDISGSSIAKPMTLRQVVRMRLAALADWFWADDKSRWGTALGQTLAELVGFAPGWRRVPAVSFDPKWLAAIRGGDTHTEAQPTGNPQKT